MTVINLESLGMGAGLVFIPEQRAYCATINQEQVRLEPDELKQLSKLTDKIKR